MGKSSWDTSPGYRYWRGAYGAAQAPWRPSGGAKNKEQRDAGAASFPAYDQRPAPKGKAKASRSDAPPGPPGGSAMVQRALNNTRKAEGRVQRLTEDRAQAEELWLKYLHDHKQAYLRERARHLKFLETSAREIEMAEQQQMEARASLRATVLEAATSQPTDQAMEVDPDWDSFLGAGTTGCLCGGSATCYAGPRAGAAGGPTYVPDSRLPGAPAASAAPAASPPPGTLSPGPGPESTMTDPYIGTSPVHPAGPDAALPRERRTSPLHPGQRPPGAVRVPTTVEAPREGSSPPPVPRIRLFTPLRKGSPWPTSLP